MTGKTGKSGTRKKKGGGRWIILGLLLAIVTLAAACGLIYSCGSSTKDVTKPTTVTGEGKQVTSLVDEAREAQRILDNILLEKKDNWQLSENGHAIVEVKTGEKEKLVHISQRDLAIGLPPSTSLSGAGAWLKEQAEKHGLVYLGGEAATYKGWDAYKAQVGIAVKAGSAKENFATDKITFFHNTNLKNKDKDVKDLPKEKPLTGRRYSGKLAVIVDDCGYELKNLRGMLNIGLPFSFAILPDKDFSSDALELIKNKGRIALLHLPMEPLDGAQMSEGANTIKVSMTEQQKRELLRKHLLGLLGVSGVNNHQGSKATADEATMTVVLKELKAQGLFFIDSRTNSRSVAADTAKKLKVKTARNDIFLDNSTDPEEIRRQIHKACAMAEKNGSAIAICHVRPGTLRCWEKYADEIKKTGITFVPVTQLLY